MDEVIYLKTSAMDELLNDEDVSDDIKNYLNYLDIDGRIVLLQNDGDISYVHLTAENDLLKKVNDSIDDSTCNPFITDTDGIVYLSGTSSCIDFNYVWYSGKLWRITSINPDGTMKMITEKLMTTLEWGADTTYSTSYIREWLNQEFLPTLYNYENIIVTNAGWYSVKDSSSPPKKQLVIIL